MIKKPDFLHVDTDSWKSEVGVSMVQEKWGKLVFGVLINIQESEKLL